MTIHPVDIDAAAARFKHHGRVSVFAGRLIPTVRTLISVPAGVVRMPLGQFLIFSTIGTFAWMTALTLAGYLLGQAYDTVADYIGPISTGVLVVLVAVYIYRVAIYKKERQ